MQTFLPDPDFAASAQALDSRRLNKQICEVAQILNALDPDYYSERALYRARQSGRSPRKGWTSHPAVRMWRGHEGCLAIYGVACYTEHVERGGTDRHRAYPAIHRHLSGPEFPPDWLGDDAVHVAHRSRLIEKMPEHYGPMWPGTPRVHLARLRGARARHGRMSAP